LLDLFAGPWQVLTREFVPFPVEKPLHFGQQGEPLLRFNDRFLIIVSEQDLRRLLHPGPSENSKVPILFGAVCNLNY